MANNFLAIDAGGTSTRAIIFDSEGHIKGVGLSQGGNPNSVGKKRAVQFILEAVDRASSASPQSKWSFATLAAAGGAQIKNLDALETLLNDRGLIGSFALCGDSEAMYWSGTTEPNGYALIVGTGAVATQIHETKAVKIVDGLGWLVGDFGSGFWIGREVVIAVLSQIDGLNAPTSLTPLLCESIGLNPSDPELRTQLVDFVYGQKPTALSQFAKLAFIDPHDQIAQDIRARAQSQLLHTFNTLITPQQPGPVILGGGIATHFQDFIHAIRQKSIEVWGHDYVTIVQNGLVGAAMLTLMAHHKQQNLPQNTLKLRSCFDNLVHELAKFSS